VVESTGYPYEHHAYRMPDLADATTYPSGAYPADAAWSADSSTVAIGRSDTSSFDPDVLLYKKGSTTPNYAVDFRSGDNLWKGTLLVNRDGSRAWAVSYDDYYQERYLLHSFGPAHPPKAPVTDLAVTATTGSGNQKSTAYLPVTWSSPMSGPSGAGGDHYWWITASTNGGAEKEFGRGRMDTTGKASATYALPKGTTTFTVHYKDFEGWYPPGYDTATPDPLTSVRLGCSLSGRAAPAPRRIAGFLVEDPIKQVGSFVRLAATRSVTRSVVGTLRGATTFGRSGVSARSDAGHVRRARSAEIINDLKEYA
jgi:hypothetical protein